MGKAWSKILIVSEAHFFLGIKFEPHEFLKNLYYIYNAFIFFVLTTIGLNLLRIKINKEKLLSGMLTSGKQTFNNQCDMSANNRTQNKI